MTLEEADPKQVLARSKEETAHLQNLLERSDHKAGFVLAGVAFLSLFVQQGRFHPTVSIIAYSFYGLSVLCVAVTSLPRKFTWYSRMTPEEQYRAYATQTPKAQARESVEQEVELRAVYRYKWLVLYTGFASLFSGTIATLVGAWIWFLESW